MDPLVSVIMPVYNVENYISKSIESVLNQTYSAFELIIVIDGSKDNSCTIAENYATQDSRIKIVYKENGGLSDARNYGLNIAKGDYYYFIDSDDYIDKKLLEEVVYYADNNDLDVVTFGFYVDFENDKFNTYYSYEVRPRNGIYNSCNINTIIVDEGFYNYIGYAWNKLYKSTIIKNNNKCFINGLSLIEDIEFNYLVFKDTEKIGFIDKVFYHYIQRNRKSLVNAQYDNFYELKLRAAKLRVEILENWNIDNNFLEKESHKLYLGALNSGLSNICKCKDLSMNKKRIKIKEIIDFDRSINYKNIFNHSIDIKSKVLSILIMMKMYRLIIFNYRLINKLRG